jgi:hypothetical protein
MGQWGDLTTPSIPSIWDVSLSLQTSKEPMRYGFTQEFSRKFSNSRLNLPYQSPKDRLAIVKESQMRLIQNWLRRRSQPAIACFQQAYIAHQGNLYAVNLGIREVAVEKISGTYTRCKDVRRGFTPRGINVQRRIRRVRRRMTRGESLDPISLIKLETDYYISQGHTQVIAAKRLDWERITAHVTAYQRPRESLEGLLANERKAFERRTGLRGITLSRAGGYQQLANQVKAHHAFLEQTEGGLYLYGEAVADWWQNLYAPITRGFRQDNVQEMIPGLTFGDYYLYLTEYVHREAQALEIPLSHALYDLLHGTRRDWQTILSVILPPCLFTGECPN